MRDNIGDSILVRLMRAGDLRWSGHTDPYVFQTDRRLLILEGAPRQTRYVTEDALYVAVFSKAPS